MSRIVRILPAAVLLLFSCASAPTTDGPPASGASPPVLPASALPHMTSDAAPVDTDHLANEVTHPDDLRSLLDDAGFVHAAQRSFGGGRGAFSRVVARGLVFEADAGAAAFVGWFGEHAPEEIITSERISRPGCPRASSSSATCPTAAVTTTCRSSSRRGNGASRCSPCMPAGAARTCEPSSN